MLHYAKIVIVKRHGQFTMKEKGSAMCSVTLKAEKMLAAMRLTSIASKSQKTDSMVALKH